MSAPDHYFSQIFTFSRLLKIGEFPLSSKRKSLQHTTESIQWKIWTNLTQGFTTKSNKVFHEIPFITCLSIEKYLNHFRTKKWSKKQPAIFRNLYFWPYFGKVFSALRGTAKSIQWKIWPGFTTKRLKVFVAKIFQDFITGKYFFASLWLFQDIRRRYQSWEMAYQS